MKIEKCKLNSSLAISSAKRSHNLKFSVFNFHPRSPHPAETKSKTKGSEDKIVTPATLRLTTGGQMVLEEAVDEWKLSADGQTLMQTTRLTPHVAGPEGSFVVSAHRPDDKRAYSLVSK